MIDGAILYPGFVGASYTSRAKTAAQELTKNFYPELIRTPFGKNAAILMPTPGYTPWVTLPTAPIRGTSFEGGRFFVAAGDTLYEVQANGSYTAVGTIAFTDTLPVSWGRHTINGGELVIGASGNAYRLDLTTMAWSTVLTGGITQVAFLGSYFVALKAAENLYRWSDLFDATVWPGDNVFVRSNRSDAWRSMLVVDERLFLFGETSSDVHWPGGAYPNIFQPLPGGTMPMGIGAPASAVDLRGNAIWLASGGFGQGGVVMAEGLSPRPIGHSALQQALESYTAVDDAIGAVYEMDGHTFYLLTLPSARVTWAWDVTIPGAWCERGTWIAEENDYDYLRPTFHAYPFGMHIVGDRESGTLYRMALDIYTDVDGRPIRRMRRAPGLSQLGRQIHYPYFALELQTGVAPLGVDPLIELRLSDNGGVTFYSVGFRTAGKQGEFNTFLAEWYGLGMAVDRVFEVVMSDPAPYRLTNAFLGTGPV